MKQKHTLLNGAIVGSVVGKDGQLSGSVDDWPGGWGWLIASWSYLTGIPTMSFYAQIDGGSIPLPEFAPIDLVAIRDSSLARRFYAPRGVSLVVEVATTAKDQIHLNQIYVLGDF